MRWVTMVTLLLLLGVSYGLYQLKYRVEGLQQRAEQLNTQIADDKRAIKVLGAEWAYLTRPQRLQRLSGEFLPLVPVQAEQIAAMDELPLKPMIGLEPAGPVIDDLSLNPVTGEIDGGPDMDLGDSITLNPALESSGATNLDPGLLKNATFVIDGDAP